MWFIGVKIGEADGGNLVLSKSVKRFLVQVIKAADKTRYVKYGADKFRFGDGSGDHEKTPPNLMRLLNYSEDNYKKLQRNTKLVDLRI